MIYKAVGQLVIAALMTTLLPANGAYLESSAGVDSASAADGLTSEEISNINLTLPLISEREMITYPTKVDQDSYGVVTTAQSAIVVDAASGMVLFAKHPDQQRSIGSVTKLMTALVFLDQNPDLDEKVTLDINVDLIEGGRIYLAFDDPITLRELLGASLVGSDNTATQSLARFVGLTENEFVQKMNDKARELGMESSVFIDPTGIQAGNLSTARDLIKLLRAAEENQIIKKYMTSPKITVYQASGRAIEIENTNELLTSYLNVGDYRIDAGKTGYLPEAGYVLISAIEQGNNKVYAAVLGSQSKETRAQEVKSLAAWAFKVFKWPE